MGQTLYNFLSFPSYSFSVARKKKSIELKRKTKKCGSIRKRDGLILQLLTSEPTHRACLQQELTFIDCSGFVATHFDCWMLVCVGGMMRDGGVFLQTLRLLIYAGGQTASSACPRHQTRRHHSVGQLVLLPYSITSQRLNRTEQMRTRYSTCLTHLKNSSLFTWWSDMGGLTRCVLGYLVEHREVRMQQANDCSWCGFGEKLLQLLRASALIFSAYCQCSRLA